MLYGVLKNLLSKKESDAVQSSWNLNAYHRKASKTIIFAVAAPLLPYILQNPVLPVETNL